MCWKEKVYFDLAKTLNKCTECPQETLLDLAVCLDFKGVDYIHARYKYDFTVAVFDIFMWCDRKGVEMSDLVKALQYARYQSSLYSAYISKLQNHECDWSPHHI